MVVDSLPFLFVTLEDVSFEPSALSFFELFEAAVVSKLLLPVEPEVEEPEVLERPEW